VSIQGIGGIDEKSSRCTRRYILGCPFIKRYRSAELRHPRDCRGSNPGGRRCRTESGAAKDFAGATANYAEDASWLPPHAPIVQGREAIRGAWAQLLTTPGLKIDWQITKVDVSRAGDMAYTLYKYEMTMSGPNGAPVTDKGKDMSVWVKQSDGTWKMVADTFNSDMPLPPGTTK
jgi:uncharacterized protein (TIGR02246 family)